MRTVLLAIIAAAALACRILLPLTTPDVRAGVRLRLSAMAPPRSHPLPDLEDWLEDYQAYQILDTLPEPPRTPDPETEDYPEVT